ncbi:MAG: heme exporter protein D [Oceanospirillaceae bacterium]|jgi:heme exporter protein D|tara:strand:- start:782 stop:976 length:195 start_codon:yes stop_codon:yes gene_type:complete
MTFQFESLQQLLTMDGHGFYVWTAVLVSMAVMLWLIVSPLLDSRRALKDVARDIARAANSKEET